jgi:hypothetical protein
MRVSPSESNAPEELGVVTQYVAAFNRGDYFEAHEILEDLWLPLRRTPEGEFWQALIQLAAVFVHVGKGRPGPARQLLRASRERFERATPVADDWRDLHRSAVRVIRDWSPRIEAEKGAGLVTAPGLDPPRLDGPCRSPPDPSV